MLFARPQLTTRRAIRRARHVISVSLVCAQPPHSRAPGTDRKVGLTHNEADGRGALPAQVTSTRRGGFCNMAARVESCPNQGECERALVAPNGGSRSRQVSFAYVIQLRHSISCPPQAGLPIVMVLPSLPPEQLISAAVVTYCWLGALFCRWLAARQISFAANGAKLYSMDAIVDRKKSV